MVKMHQALGFLPTLVFFTLLPTISGRDLVKVEDFFQIKRGEHGAGKVGNDKDAQHRSTSTSYVVTVDIPKIHGVDK